MEDEKLFFALKPFQMLEIEQTTEVMNILEDIGLLQQGY